MIGKIAIVAHNINMGVRTNQFLKGERAIMIEPTSGIFNARIKSLDGKRTSVGNVFIAGTKQSSVHFFLEEDKTAQVLFGKV